MKTLTLTQPWASLVAIGAKRIETRSWGTNYRGPLAIHAAKGFPAGARGLCLSHPFRAALAAGGLAIGQSVVNDRPRHTLPLGAVVAVCTLVTCIRLDDDLTVRDALILSDAPHERDFGDYALGRYAWILRDVRRLPAPIPARGALGLWEWHAPAAVTEALPKGGG